jgi:ectoine hydroxylase-related dioxygenase (phytanoyl-CoA dioxygenase family)
MANETGFTTDKFERVDDILQNLKREAEQAENDGDAFTLSVYNTLIKYTKEVVVKAKARMEREAAAQSKRREKELRARDRAAKLAAKQQRNVTDNEDTEL